MVRRFSKTELKHLKFLYMRRGFNEKEADEHILEVVSWDAKNHKNVLDTQKEEKAREKLSKQAPGIFKQEFKVLKGGSNGLD